MDDNYNNSAAAANFATAVRTATDAPPPELGLSTNAVACIIHPDGTITGPRQDRCLNWVQAHDKIPAAPKLIVRQDPPTQVLGVKNDHKIDPLFVWITIVLAVLAVFGVAKILSKAWSLK